MFPLSCKENFKIHPSNGAISYTFLNQNNVLLHFQLISFFARYLRHGPSPSSNVGGYIPSPGIDAYICPCPLLFHDLFPLLQLPLLSFFFPFSFPQVFTLFLPFPALSSSLFSLPLLLFIDCSGLSGLVENMKV